MVLCNILMAWGGSATLTDGFEWAREVLISWFPMSLRPGATYTGFIEVSLRHGSVLLTIFQERMWGLVRQVASRGHCWRTRGWVLFGGDGTREPAPRTKGNLKGLGGMGRDRKSPQAWLTPLLHLATGLPWCFTVGRGDGSEREHVRQMLGSLPEDSLFIGDAGFVGYGLWLTMIQRGQPFLIRVGSNVTLIKGLAKATGSKMRLTHTGIVWLWPRGERDGGRSGGRSGGPLMLRLIELHDGRSPVYLATNVIDAARLSQEDAAEFYKMRWCVELWFRSMKQTMEKRKLRSCTPERALMELSWMAAGLSVLGLMHVEGLIDAGQAPAMASVAGALRVVRGALRRGDRARPGGRRSRKALLSRLGQTMRDGYERRGPKQTTRYPRKKRYRRAGPPTVREATTEEKREYHRFMHATQVRAFTA